jgi:hypothetical protein
MAQRKTAIIDKEEYDSIFNLEGEYIGYPIYRLTIDWANDLGDPPTWTEATAQYATSVALCERCAKFDCKELFRRYDEDVARVPESDAFEISLGQIDKMLQSRCGFCKFLVDVAVYLRRGAGLPSDALCTLKRIAGSVSKSTVFSIDCTSAKLLGMDRPCFRPDGTPASPWQPLAMVALLAQGCINHHPKCRQQASLGLRMKTQLFVIDLNKLVLVPAPQNCSYVALSYVWGPQTGEYEI